MKTPVPARTLSRIPVFTCDGTRTSVSIPEMLLEECVQAFGSRDEFMKHLHKAVRDTDPRPGFSRSQLVRIALEEQLLRSLLENQKNLARARYARHLLTPAPDTLGHSP